MNGFTQFQTLPALDIVEQFAKADKPWTGSMQKWQQLWVVIQNSTHNTQSKNIIFPIL